MRTYYMWKELLLGDGNKRYPVDPHGDPMLYEFPINFIFETMGEADAWLRDDAKDWGVDPEESDDWVLVMYTETIMTQGIDP